MAARRIHVGTDRGAFTYSRQANGGWEITSRWLNGWSVGAIARDTTGRLLVGAFHWVYNTSIRLSDDDGATWRTAAQTPAFTVPEGGKAITNGPGDERSLSQIWTIVPGGALHHGRIYVGVADASVFHSDDAGETWHENAGLQAHPTRPTWGPGMGGLCLHTILLHPTDPARLWVAMSSVGVFETADAGATWAVRTAGMTQSATGKREETTDRCVHGIAADPRDPEHMYVQFHAGVLRSADGGKVWENAETGLPGNFGYPVVVTKSGGALVIPMIDDQERYFTDGQLRVYRSTDFANNWVSSSHGLPTTPQYGSVLRKGMTTDLATGDVAFGTTNGEIYFSGDEGESWERLPGTVARILTVALD